MKFTTLKITEKKCYGAPYLQNLGKVGLFVGGFAIQQKPCAGAFFKFARKHEKKVNKWVGVPASQILFCTLYTWSMIIRVDTIGRDLIFLLTQCRHMIIDQQKSITFLIRTSSNYFWASEVGKNQGFQIKFINLSISKLVSN